MGTVVFGTTVVAGLSGGVAGQNTPYYLFDGDGNRAWEVRNGAVVNTFTTYSLGYPAAIRDTIWLGDRDDREAREYTLAGVPTGNTSAGGANFSQLLDGASGPNGRNYGVECCGNPDSVTIAAADWSGQARAFDIQLQNGGFGIAYDLRDDTLYVSNSGNTLITHYDLAGNVLNRIDVGRSLAALAYEQSTDTLWGYNRANAHVVQFDRNGNVLQDIQTDVPGANIWGGEMPVGPGCEPCPGDVNGDCDVTFDDLLLVLSGWGPCPGASAGAGREFYATNNLADTNYGTGGDQLIIYDFSTAAWAPVGVITDAAGPVDGIGGLDWAGGVGRGPLIGANSFGAAAPTMYAINPVDATATRIGQAPVPMHDLAYNTRNGKMYGTDSADGLWRDDNGDAIPDRFLGNYSIPNALEVGLGFDHLGNVYVLDLFNDIIYKGVSDNPASVTPLYNLPYNANFSQGLYVDESGGWHGALNGGTTTSENYWFALDGSNYALQSTFATWENGLPEVEVGDLTPLPGCEPCVGDVDGNCFVDFDDLLIVLSGWGPCPRPTSCEDPGVCPDFPPCDGEGCACFMVFEGGGKCLDASTRCEAPECPNGSEDCPPGWTCYVETCCTVNVCAPPEAECETGAAPRKVSSGMRTFSGVQP